MAEVTLKKVSKSFGRTTAISELDLTIRNGEFFVLLGPTGAGKTTTLRLIAGLEKPEEGTIIIAGQDATADAPAQRDVSFVFQQYSLYPHLSVYENLAFRSAPPAAKCLRLKLLNASSALRRWFASITSCRTVPRGFRGVKCSASRLDVRLSASRIST